MVSSGELVGGLWGWLGEEWVEDAYKQVLDGL